jgi:hypothetical protein
MKGRGEKDGKKIGVLIYFVYNSAFFNGMISSSSYS